MAKGRTVKIEKHRYIERRRGVCGGRPVLKDSRFPVSSIVINYKRGLTPDDILHEFPDLAPAAVYAALSYYFDHQEELEREIEELHRLSTEMEQGSAYRLPLHAKPYRLPGS
jgi:uncharacterized protein (DUF433 family)